VILSEGNEKKSSKLYDVDAFRKIYLETLRRRGLVGRFFGRITGFLDGMQGLFVAMLMLPLGFGTFVAVVIGVSYGPLGFLAVFGSIIGGLAFFVEKKAGRSLQFGDYSILRGAFATTVAFLGIIAVFYLLVWLRL
jgi:hypothetical protein